MIDIALIVFLQVSAPAATEVTAAKPDQPKMVCSMEPVTGTKARKQKICKPAGGFGEGAEEAQDLLRKIQGTGGNITPTPPPTALVGPG